MSPGYFSRSTGSFHRYTTHNATSSRATVKLQKRNEPFWSGLRPLRRLEIRMTTMARKVRKKSSVICPSVTKYLKDRQQMRKCYYQVQTLPYLNYTQELCTSTKYIRAVGGADVNVTVIHLWEPL